MDGAPGQCYLKTSKLLVIDSRKDGLRVNDLFFCLFTASHMQSR